MRITASGVRSSCEALATNRFCVSNAAGEPVQHRVEGGGQLGHLVVGAGVADPLVERLLAEPPGGRGDLVQRAQRPAGHRVRAGDADDADGEQREQALDQQLPLTAASTSSRLPLARASSVAAVGEHHPGAGPQLVGRVQRVADQQPGQQDQDRARADQQDAVEQGQPQPQGRAQPLRSRLRRQVDGHAAPPTADHDRFGHPVAGADHGLDQRRVAELLAQRHHGHPYGRGERVGVGVPDPFQQLLAGHHAAARLEQLLQHAELLAGQVERRAAAGDHPPGLVEHQVADGEHRRRGRGGPPAQRLHPGDQLVERERLGQVVVGAELQALDPVGDACRSRSASAPGSARRRRPASAQISSPCMPGRSRSSTTTSYRVTIRHLVPGGAVVGDVDRHALAAQPARDRVGEVPLVFHHQHPHPRSSTVLSDLPSLAADV